MKAQEQNYSRQHVCKLGRGKSNVKSSMKQPSREQKNNKLQHTEAQVHRTQRYTVNDNEGFFFFSLGPHESGERHGCRAANRAPRTRRRRRCRHRHRCWCWPSNRDHWSTRSASHSTRPRLTRAPGPSGSTWRREACLAHSGLQEDTGGGSRQDRDSSTRGGPSTGARCPH